MLALACVIALGSISASGVNGVSMQGTHAYRSSGAQAAMQETLTAAMTVHIACTCPNYNHVGNEWGQVFSIDEIMVEDGDIISLEAGQTIVIVSEITEYDEKYIDAAKDSITHQIAINDLQNGFTLTRILQVEENAGRYEGNIAEWTVSFTFLP